MMQVRLERFLGLLALFVCVTAGCIGGGAGGGTSSDDAQTSDVADDSAAADTAQGDTGNVDTATPPDAQHDTEMDTADTDEGGDADSGDQLRSCLQQCESAADCGTDDSPAFDSDNYACEAGFCEYAGCNDTAECQAQHDSSYECDQSSDLPTCRRTCSMASDCAMGLATRDEDNWSCDGGYCVMNGCNNTQECADAHSEDFVCVPADALPYDGLSRCTAKCESPADCASPPKLYDEDNYDCIEGGCVWLGCNNTEECQGLVNSDLICR